MNWLEYDDRLRSRLKWFIGLLPDSLGNRLSYELNRYFGSRGIPGYRAFIKTPLSPSVGVEFDRIFKCRVLLVSVAFNNIEVIQHQLRLMPKYIADDHVFVIADNSTQSKVSDAIRENCEALGALYLRIPQNPFSGIKGSDSHGAALNWLWQNLVKRIRPMYFGFLDHDIFPVSDFSVEEKIGNQAFYALPQFRGEQWYLWPGYCFFNYRAVKMVGLDFMPYAYESVRLDTGGGNWFRLCSGIKIKKFRVPSYSLENLREGECKQADMFERIDEWVHTFNASQWMETRDKSDDIRRFLSRY